MALRAATGALNAACTRSTMADMAIIAAHALYGHAVPNASSRSMRSSTFAARRYGHGPKCVATAATSCPLTTPSPLTSHGQFSGSSHGPRLLVTA